MRGAGNAIYSVYNELVDSMVLRKGDILVKIIDGRGKTPSGIILPVTVNNALVPDRGLVIKVCKNGNIYGLDVGDKVMFEKYQGQKMQTEDGQMYILMNTKNILGVLDADDDITIYNE